VSTTTAAGAVAGASGRLREPIVPPQRRRRPLPRVDLMGLALDAVAPAEALADVRRELALDRGGWLVTVNLESLRRYVGEPGVRSLVDAADLVVADGMPLLWAARLQRTPLPARVAGSDLVWPLSAMLAEDGVPVFLLGGNPGVADEAAAVLGRHAPALRVAGTLCPPFGFDPDDPDTVAAIRDALVAAQPRAVLCGLPFPKQERLIAALRPALPRTWFFGLGVTLSFVAGDVERAPEWMQRGGLEWTHRLVQEPRRLGRRYLVDGLPFAARLGAHAALTRAR